MNRFFRFALKVAVLGMVITSIVYAQKSSISSQNISDVKDVVKIFPKSALAIQKLADEGIADAESRIREILTVPDPLRTFGNTAKKIDDLVAFSQFSLASRVIRTLEMVSPEETVRSAAHEATMRIEEFTIDAIYNNFALYEAFKAYYDGSARQENLSEKQRYFLEETLAGFKHKGFDLSETARNEVGRLEKELAVLTLQFDTNIAADGSRVLLKKEDLQGVPEDFIASLECIDSEYVVRTDPPSYLKIMENCSNPDTRKKVYNVYLNRAYPANDILLKRIIAKRDELARVMGFESYAAYDIAPEMVKDPERVRAFLTDLQGKIKEKGNLEFEELTRVPCPSVTLSSDGKLYPWDRAFIENDYKKRHFDIDEEKIAEYFPFEKTIRGILSVYERFFSLVLKEQKIEGLWDEKLQVVEVYSQGSSEMIGCIILDLFPRPYKFSHACDINLIPATYRNNRPNTALSVIVANFPPPTQNKPSLLQRANVKTFFHELGHALHDMLGRTSFASMSGTGVKTDFVEMPSQIFEEWFADKGIIRMIGSHYETGELLPEKWIEVFSAAKKANAAFWAEQQLYYARLSLDLFDTGEQKDPARISEILSAEMKTHTVYSGDEHMYASFGHLTGYGAKYYGYMWAKVYALDLFSIIKEQGLLDPEIGERYMQQVIGQGGSVDPNILIENFLGREPSGDSFLRDIGVSL